MDDCLIKVALYETTSHYDPETKQSRPKRKYLETEDSETGELIPSSGKRGRKKTAEGDEQQKSKKPDESLRENMTSSYTSAAIRTHG